MTSPGIQSDKRKHLQQHKEILNSITTEARKWLDNARLKELKNPENRNGIFDEDQQNMLKDLAQFGEGYFARMTAIENEVFSFKWVLSATEDQKKKRRVSKTALVAVSIDVRKLAEETAGWLLREGEIDELKDTIVTKLDKVETLAYEEYNDLSSELDGQDIWPAWRSIFGVPDGDKQSQEGPGYDHKGIGDSSTVQVAPETR
jgi:hypothetical protein